MSPETGVLEQEFRACELVRPFHRAAYDAGDRIEYDVTGVIPAHEGRVRLEIERFVGGGFAGQVYRVRLLEIEPETGAIAGLEPGQHYAIKILRPPSAFAGFFRNVLYFLAYQGAFSAQVNPAAVRVGVLWQKLIRRAAALELGEEGSVCDTFATFYDADLRSFGEINEWVDGRIWKFEVDNQVFDRWDFDGEPPADQNSPEYVHKKIFMRRLVALLHEMGSPELARQYEWWTCKSQPNALKRLSAAGSPAAGLTAIDFRAGLALLFFLPMSPADFGLILRGLFRGRLVQFDRSDLPKLRQFIATRSETLEDLQPAVEELEQQEKIYRGSLPDLTHQGLRLVTSSKLRRAVKDGTVTAWTSQGRIDEEHAARLRGGRGLFSLLYVISLLPFVGPAIVKLWGDPRRREHLGLCLTSFGYLGRAMRGARLETLVQWQRHGRVDQQRALELADRPVRYWMERLLFGWLPASWHHFLAEPSYAWSRLREATALTMKFLRDPEYREQRLLEEVRIGREQGMLTGEEADKIEGQIKDPFIQKYLRCLAVHICTVPVTQVVMLLAGGAVLVYFLVYREAGWAESMAYAAATAAAIQLLPISPGSITRGVFVLFLMIKERDIRNYWVAAPVSFLHVVGYLAFPLQMVTHNPALARFLAGSWAKRMVHIVPVFGESGALLEHGIFDLFFNVPLSVARGFREHTARWVAATVVLLVALAMMAYAAVWNLWEWRQPKVEIQNAAVTAVEPHRWRVDELPWRIGGVRVRLTGLEGGVDFRAKQWEESIAVGDHVDVVIRKCFAGDGYDGLELDRR
ncbi:MAG: hypothetical protein WBH75_13270 [Thermoanaerobaculia bacterium]